MFDATINKKPQYQDKYLLGFAIKLTNKAKKISAVNVDLLAAALLQLFKDNRSNDKAKKIINQRTQHTAEKEKLQKLDDFIDDAYNAGEFFYLASSHSDCAEDHKAYQGRLYVDNRAPEEIMDYARKRGLRSMQWVIGKPVWFITRPNCRHYFVSLTLSQVTGKTLKKLSRKYKTHTKVGDYKFQTPAKAALEEYEDRLKMMNSLYWVFKTQGLKNEITKTKLLIKKWKKIL